MTIEEHIRKLTQQKQEIEEYINQNLPDIVGVEAVNFFTESFENEGFTDETFIKWQEVKRRQNPKRPKRPEANRKILAGETNELGRSIEYETQPGQVVITSDTITAGSNKSYASAHNEGTNTAGKNHNITIPKRQFIGESKTLDKKIIEKTQSDLLEIINR
jgi:phage gpG-like protein